MRTGRSVSLLIALLAVTLVSTTSHAQTSPRQQTSPRDDEKTQVVKPGDVTIEPESVDAVDPDDLSLGDPQTLADPQTSRAEQDRRRHRQSAAAALRGQVEAEIAEARRRALHFETAFGKVQRQFVQTDPGEQATVSEEVLEEFERDLDELETRFNRAERGFDALGDDQRAEHAREALSALDILRAQLGLLGLRLVERGERARVANALEFDFELLVESLEALHGPIVVGDREFDDDIIRPPEGVDPSGELIRPPEGVAPSDEIIRPDEGIEPSREIIRPARGVDPSDEIIRPPQGIEPSREIIRPAEGIEPSREIIRPPTSKNPALDD